MSDLEHRIYLLGQIGKALFNSRLHRDEELRKGRGLMVYPQPTPEEEQNILGLASLLNQLQGNALLQHPKLPLLLAATRDCSPRQVYLFTQGDYNQRYLEFIQKAVRTGDLLLELGAGFGLGCILAMKTGAAKALAVEPHPLMGQVIQRNAEANKVLVEVRPGCVVPGQTQGETQFHIVEEGWASNIFTHLHDERTDSVSVPVISVEAVLQQYQPTILAIDIQGSELGLFNQLSLDSVRELVIAIHTPLLGEKATAETITAITRHGFVLRDIAGWVYYFSKA